MGRPTKFDKIPWDLVARMVQDAGFTDEEISKVCGISRSTLSKYKKEKKEFSDALKGWKSVADERVERALYERAIGYTHEDTYFASYQGTVVTEVYDKHYPPETLACIYWLNNRKSDVWRNRKDETGVDLSSEQIDALRKRATQLMHENL